MEERHCKKLKVQYLKLKIFKLQKNNFKMSKSFKGGFLKFSLKVLHQKSAKIEMMYYRPQYIYSANRIG